MKRGNKSEWIDRLSEPADGKDVGIPAWHRFVAGRNSDVDMVGVAGWEGSTIYTFLSIMDKVVKVSSKQTFQKC